MTAAARELLEDSKSVRRAIRSGQWTSQTSGLAPGYVQGNLVILPAAWAADFARYCQLNPKPCPLLASSNPGAVALPTLGDDIDIRFDLPRYRIWRAGQLVDEVSDVADLWRNDLVTFVIGCSFSFEGALTEAGISLRHLQEGKNVAMYRTNIATIPSGPFQGPMVVSMRPLTAADAIQAIQVTSQFPAAHGAPIHLGDPAIIGIDNIDAPEFGDSTTILAGEIPVFWACGVTPQAAVMAARPEFCITHAPGAMLITDRLNAELRFAG